jgi:4-hydroxybenzoate polyprenyltransferase
LHKDIETDPDKVKYLHKRKEYYKYILFFYLLLTAIILVILNNIGLLGYFIIITAGGILYTIVFKELTRTVPGFKSFYVALIWAYHGTFFAVFFYNININILIFIIFTFIFLKSFVNVTFFDIKDIETDNKENLKTLPVIFGKYKTIIILYLLNTLSLILLLYCIYIEILPFYMISLSIFYIYTMYYLYKGRTAKKAELLKYSYIMADSEFILWPFILILGKIIFSQWV